MGLLEKIGLRRERTAAGPVIEVGQPAERRSIGPGMVPLQSMYVPGMFITAANDTGITVTEYTAMAANAIYACVGVIASAVSRLPMEFHDKTGGLIEHPLVTLLDDAPNQYMTAPTFKECYMLNLLLWGNGYAFIDKNFYGDVTSIFPLLSSATRPLRVGSELYYQTWLGTENFTFRPDQILHTLNISYDGVYGISPIRQQQQAVGLSIGLERFAAGFIGAGAVPSGILKLPPDMQDDQIKRFRDKWVTEYSGPDNRFKTAVLPEGYSWTPTSVDMDKAQVQQARVHQIREACRIYRVPPHKVADLERATFSNIEHQSLEFGQDTVAPWLEKIEKESKRKLLTEREKLLISPKFNMDAILRADMTTRFNGYRNAIFAGWMQPNEARIREGLRPVAGGWGLRQPLNTAILGDGNPNEPAPIEPAPAGA